MATAAVTTPTAALPTPIWLSRFAWSLLGFMVFVVLWGAVVRATGSGAGCGANWPLCNGDFLPHHPKLTTLIEFLHRSQTGVLTVGFVVLLAAIFSVTPRKHPARAAVLWASFFLVSEALLGAVLVLKHLVEQNTRTLRVVMQSIHFTNTMLLIASLAITARRLGDGVATERSSAVSRGSAILAVVATLVVGATGSLAALADTLFPSPNLAAAFAADFNAASPLLVRMRWVHPAASVVAFLCVLYLCTRVRPLTRQSRVVLGLVVLQFALGGLDVLLLAPTWMQIVHLLGADIYWIALVILAAQQLAPGSVAKAQWDGASVSEPARV